MLYRPKFCANCGDKIERVEWPLTASRRFCPVCESEYKGQDLIPRVLVGAGVLMGILGLGSYLNVGPPRDTVLLKQPKKAAEVTSGRQEMPKNVAASAGTIDTAGVNSGQLQAAPQVQMPGNATNAPSPVRPAGLQTPVAQQQYFCGAETKKGTPCSRRVKGNVRCYQHQGMPAMAGAEKLKIN